MTAERWIAGCALLAALSGCAHGPRFDGRGGRVCVVLSAGAADGAAHVGALAAVREASVPVSCVVGSSMGALVGAVYATAPREDARRRFEALLDAYAAETRAAAGRRGLAFAIVGGALGALASRGESAAVPALAAGGGYLLGAATTAKVDRDRLVGVMDAFFGGRSLQQLPVALVPLALRPRGTGVTLVAPRSGNVAAAVGDSIANPLVFPDVDVASGAAVDPGVDRAAAVPIDDACRAFPGANLLAINVTGHPAFVSAAMRCPLREVMVPPAGLTLDELSARGPAYQRALQVAHDLTRAALRAP